MIGPYTAEIIEYMLAVRQHPEQAYRSCLGLMKLARHHPTEYLEMASAHAVSINSRSYTSVKSILEKGLFQTTVALSEDDNPTPMHENIRGAAYYANVFRNLKMQKNAALRYTALFIFMQFGQQFSCTFTPPG